MVKTRNLLFKFGGSLTFVFDDLFEKQILQAAS